MSHITNTQAFDLARNVIAIAFLRGMSVESILEKVFSERTPTQRSILWATFKRGDGILKNKRHIRFANFCGVRPADLLHHYPDKSLEEVWRKKLIEAEISIEAETSLDLSTVPKVIVKKVTVTKSPRKEQQSEVVYNELYTQHTVGKWLAILAGKTATHVALEISGTAVDSEHIGYIRSGEVIVSSNDLFAFLEEVESFGDYADTEAYCKIQAFVDAFTAPAGNANAKITESGQIEKEKDTKMSAYHKLFKEEAVGKALAALARKTEAKRVPLKVGGKIADDSQLAAIDSGSILVSLADIAIFLDEADQAGFSQSEEFLEVDSFVTKAKKASAAVDEGLSSAVVATVSEKSPTAAPPPSEHSTEERVMQISQIQWGEDQTIINGRVFNMRPNVSGGGRMQVYSVINQYRNQYSLTWNEINKMLGLTRSVINNLSHGTTYVDQERGESWAKALGITVTQLFGVDSLPAPSLAESKKAETESHGATTSDVQTPEIVSESDEYPEAVSPTLEPDPVSVESLEDTPSAGVVEECSEVTEEAEDVGVETTSPVSESPVSNGHDKAVVANHANGSGNGSTHTSTDLFGQELSPNPTREEMADYLANNIAVVPGDGQTKKLELLHRMARGEDVSPSEVYPGRKERLAAEAALAEFKAVNPMGYATWIAQQAQQV